MSSSILAWALAAGLAVASEGAAAHPGPPVWGELVVGEERVTFVVHAEPQPLSRCLGTDVDYVGPHDPLVREHLVEGLREAFRDRPRVWFDDEPVLPTFVGATFPEDSVELDGGWLVVDVELTFPVAAVPRRIRLLWERFEGTEWGGEQFVPFTVRHGRLPEVFSLWPEEPELVWHAPLPSLATASPAVVPAPVATSVPRWRLPLAALGALLLGAAATLALRRRPAPARWGTVVVTAALAVLLRETWVVPVGARTPPRPGEDDALAIFDRLHAGVYRAFEARTEGEIYDLLAAAVAPALVDPLYGEVYESLVMREDGGALCSIEGVDVHERRVRLPAAGDGFLVEAAWDVRGIVSHWGHIHRRRNTYRADYTVGRFARSGDDPAPSWKIAAVEVLQHERVDE